LILHQLKEEYHRDPGPLTSCRPFGKPFDKLRINSIQAPNSCRPIAGRCCASTGNAGESKEPPYSQGGGFAFTTVAVQAEHDSKESSLALTRLPL
jgi:hypothetical protein